MSPCGVPDAPDARCSAAETDRLGCESQSVEMLVAVVLWSLMADGTKEPPQRFEARGWMTLRLTQPLRRMVCLISLWIWGWFLCVINALLTCDNNS